MRCAYPVAPTPEQHTAIFTCSSSFIRVSLLISNMWMSFERTSDRTARLSLEVVDSMTLSLGGADGFCGE